MPFLRPQEPLTGKQRHLRLVIGLVLPAFGIGLGLWEAIDCAKIRFGYIASYEFAIALFLGGFLCAVGLLLLPYWRTRSGGVALVAAGVLSYATFLGGITILKKLDRVAWQHDPPMQHVADATDAASLVLYFRKGTSNQEVNDFIQNVLEQPSTLHDGRDTPDFVTEYYLIYTDGYEGYAMNFLGNAPASKTSAYIGSIKSDHRIDRVFTNVVPNSIKLNDAPLNPEPIEHKDPRTQ